MSVDGIGDADFLAFVDPTITIDPAWVAAHPGSYVQFSVPTSAIPEPSSLLPLGSGIVGLAGAIRRKLAR